MRRGTLPSPRTVRPGVISGPLRRHARAASTPTWNHVTNVAASIDMDPLKSALFTNTMDMDTTLRARACVQKHQLVSLASTPAVRARARTSMRPRHRRSARDH
jgi:hypothetical protein